MAVVGRERKREAGMLEAYEQAAQKAEKAWCAWRVVLVVGMLETEKAYREVIVAGKERSAAVQKSGQKVRGKGRQAVYKEAGRQKSAAECRREQQGKSAVAAQQSQKPAHARAYGTRHCIKNQTTG